MGLALLGLTLLLGSPQIVSAQTITEFPLPAAGSNPAFITAGPDGSLWFTEFSFNPKVARITVAGTVSEFPTSGGVAPFGIAAGPDGNLWFTEAFGPDYHTFSPAIVRITPAGVLTRFQLPESSNPFDITAGPDGSLWFTESVDNDPSRNRIGRITTAGVLTEFPIPDGPRQITAGPDGNLWFTVPNRNTIGRITTGGAITEFPIPTASSGAEGITTGPDGNLWFAESEGNKIGRIATTGSVTEFPIPTVHSSPFEINVGPDGNLWFTERIGNKIGRITPAGLITEFPIPTLASLPSGITTGPDGNIWFTELNGNKIGRLALTGAPALETRILPVVGSTPGANGTFFKTSVQLHNPTSSEISGRIVFHPSGVSGSDSDPSLSYSLEPGQTQSIADLLPAMGRSGLGSADIAVVSGSAPAASVRVFNDAAEAGTTGFTEEPMRPENALLAGRQAVLLVPADLTAFRFNIGIRTLGEGASITLTSRDAGGEALDRVQRSFPAVYHEQEGAGGFLKGGHHEIPPGGTVTVTVNSGSAIVYGATVDNRTGDPSLQIARAVP